MQCFSLHVEFFMFFQRTQKCVSIRPFFWTFCLFPTISFTFSTTFYYFMMLLLVDLLLPKMFRIGPSHENLSFYIRSFHPPNFKRLNFYMKNSPTKCMVRMLGRPNVSVLSERIWIPIDFVFRNQFAMCYDYWLTTKNIEHKTYLNV